MRFRLVAALLAALSASPALASGDGASANWALSEFGGTAADRQMLYTGTPGILMGTSPASILLIFWRRLHGQTVDTETGDALTTPCCVGAPGGGSPAVMRWLALRKTVPGTEPLGEFLQTERSGPDYASIPNCLDDAFRNAADTLQARLDSYGAASPDLRFWLTAQDTVFAACAKPGAGLLPLPATAPAWLQADYRYQQAALAFYDADYTEAAAAFAEIAHDATSPWHDIAPYLRVRALLRKALASKTTGDLFAARAAARGIDAANPFHQAARKFDTMAELRADPDAAANRLAAALQAPTLTPQAAADFKDLQSLPANVAPEPLDWINTVKTGAAAPPTPPDLKGTPLEQARAADDRRVAALAHARDRYAATRDSAWMLAVLALMQPDDASDAAFMAEAAAVEPQAPAYLTALYHRLRLTNGAGDPAAARAPLDTVLARTDLTTTTRNLFTAERLQVASSLADFARDSLRKLVCARESDGCKTGDWGYAGVGGALFDAPLETATVGIGDDARYLIDRMALATRITLGDRSHLAGRDPPRPRTHQFHPRRAAARRCGGRRRRPAAAEAAAAHGRRVRGGAPRPGRRQAARRICRLRQDPGPARRFAGLHAPGRRGRRLPGRLAELGGSQAARPGLHRPRSFALRCRQLSNAGRSCRHRFRRRPPPSAGRDLRRHVRRGRFRAAPAGIPRRHRHARHRRAPLPPAPRQIWRCWRDTDDARRSLPQRDAQVKSKPAPQGATYVWQYLLDAAAQRPSDPRVPELLHWLIHIGHYGQSHDHSGRRAFQLLHRNYPNSAWTQQNPFFYD